MLSGAPLIDTGHPGVQPSAPGSPRSAAVEDATSEPPAAAAPTATPRPTRDAVRPTIASRTPGPNAVNVAGRTSVRIRFSEPVRGVSGSTIRLVNVAGGWVVRATVSYDAATRTATLNPALNMYPGTQYRVNVLAGITDVSGNRLAPASWTFRVAPG